MRVKDKKERFIHLWQPEVPRKLFNDSLNELIQEVRNEQRKQFEVAIVQATGSTELVETIYNIMPELKEDSL